MDPPAIGARAVLYGAKSTADPKGSIDAQLADCRAAAEAEGREVVAEFSDEAASAYSGNRGDGLTRAMERAERDGCELWVQHSDRLARGDGAQSRHLVELVLWARKAGVTLRSMQDAQTFDGMGLVYAALMGDRNHDDSARKSTATRDGLRRRRDDRGEPVGALLDGYRVEATGELDERGKPVTRRVIDEARMRAVVLRAMSLIESGHTPGDVARLFNREGLRTNRGNTWTTRTMRRMVENAKYTGEGGYPAAVTRDRHDRLLASLNRLDLVAVRARTGGRTPVEQYLLRGIASCGRCGTSLYTRRFAAGRFYICGAVREARGTCDAPRICAEAAEGVVMRYLDEFLDDVRGWLEQQATAASGERDRLEQAASAARDELRTLERRLGRARAQWEQHTDAGDDDLARAALRQVARIEKDIEGQQQAADDARARADEWTPSPNAGGWLDVAIALQQAVQGRLSDATSIKELRAALRDMLTGLTLAAAAPGHAVVQATLRTGEKRLWSALGDADIRIPWSQRERATSAETLSLLRRDQGRTKPRTIPARRIGAQTFVYVQPVRAQISA